MDMIYPHTREVNDVRIAKAICLINGGYDQNLDFDSLAETLNLSPSRLRHLFKAELGMPFKKYLRQVRMKRAKHLLETSFLTVNEVAKQVGISDSSHFVKYFQSQYGISPGKYRKSHHLARKKLAFLTGM